MKIRVEHDVYNIAKRIKDIDRNYYIMFDTSKQKFELHNSAQIGSSFCLTLPREKLCEYDLKHIRKTQSVNIDEILENLENDNNTRESAKKTRAFSTIIDSINDLEN